MDLASWNIGANITTSSACQNLSNYFWSKCLYIYFVADAIDRQAFLTNAECSYLFRKKMLKSWLGKVFVFVFPCIWHLPKWPSRNWNIKIWSPSKTRSFSKRKLEFDNCASFPSWECSEISWLIFCASCIDEKPAVLAQVKTHMSLVSIRKILQIPKWLHLLVMRGKRKKDRCWNKQTESEKILFVEYRRQLTTNDKFLSFVKTGSNFSLLPFRRWRMIIKISLLLSCQLQTSSLI